MSNWKIKTFITARGTDVIQKWLDDLPIKAQVAIDERIRFLATLQHWERPFAAKLKGYDDIWEVIVQSERVQYRPLGCFGPGEKVFSLLIGAVEKGNRFEPKDAPTTAEKRKNLVYQNERYLDEYY
jgi:hypothetical protein